MPNLAIIVAMTRDRIIGSGNGLPWNIPGDLRLFRRLTANATLIMGRRTHVAIGRPLPGRHNIVLSRTIRDLTGVEVCDNLMNALRAAARRGRPVFVIGGAHVYREALPIVAELHISWIRNDYAGDVRFPEFDLSAWTACEDREDPEFHYTRYCRGQQSGRKRCDPDCSGDEHARPSISY